ncbi:hypothetical protein Tco_1133603 [Tanacetum coccineum]
MSSSNPNNIKKTFNPNSGAGASSTGTGEATLAEGEKNSSNTVETQDLIHASMVVQTVLKEEGLERVLNRMLQKSYIEVRVLNRVVQKPFPLAYQN